MMGFLMTSAQNSLSLMVTKESTTLAPIKTVGTNKNKWEKKDCWYFPQGRGLWTVCRLWAICVSKGTNAGLEEENRAIGSKVDLLVSIGEAPLFTPETVAE